MAALSFAGKLEKDGAKRSVEVPEELARTFKKHAAAKKVWGTLSSSHQREYADWISDAKKEETRVSRSEKAVAMLVDGKRLKG